jgi:hypothetical protein
MGIRISQLPETKTIDVTEDLIPIVQEGITKKILLDYVKHPDQNSVFNNVKGLSSNWNSVYTSVNRVSSNWNSVYTSVLNASASNASINYVNSNYLPLTGGTINGNLYVLSSVEILPNNPITTFYVDDQKVGINTETPNAELTVNGSISSNNTIYDKNGNSDIWNSVYTSFTANSASYTTKSNSDLTVLGNIALSGNVLPYTSGKGSFIVLVSDPINLLAAAGTLSSVYKCPDGFRFLPEEISYTYDTINYTGTPTNPTITNPVVRIYNSNLTTITTDLGPPFTFPFNESTQLLNRWFRSSNTSSTLIGRPMLIGGSAVADTAYLRIDTAYASTDGSNKYTDVKIKVILTGYLIKN